MWFWRKKSEPSYPLGNQCSFCSKREFGKAKLFPGFDNAYICDECLEVSEEIFRDREEKPFSSPPLNLHCSFCLKTDQEVKYLVAGPTVYICDACVRHYRQSVE